MRGSHRRSPKGTRLFVLNLSALVITLVLAVGQFGFVAAAGATDRGRDGSFSSDTEVISTDKGGDAGGSGASSGIVASRPTVEDGAKAPAPGNNVTLCHASKSIGNPFQLITVDVSSAAGQQQLFGNGGHSSHQGTPPGNFFDPATSQNGDDWTDIIPPFKWPDPVTGPNDFPGLGWTAAGQQIWNNNCVPLATLAAPVKSAPGSVAVGSTGNQFTISVTNNGTGTANNVTVTDTVNAAFIVTAVTFTNPNGNGACATSNNVNCNVGTLQPGETAVVTITFSVSANATCPGPITNQAAAAIGNGAATNSNQTSTTITGCPPPGTPDMSIVKSGPATITPGGQISYTITTTNLGNAAATNVSFTDTIPPGTSFVSATATGSWNVTLNGTTLTFSKASVAAGETATHNVTVNVDANAACGSTITNTATISPGGGNAGNDSSTVVTTVVCPDLQITKTDGSTSVDQGGQTAYTISVKNGGTAAASNVTVTDVLPAGTTFVSAVAPAGWNATTPAVGANGTVTFTKGSMAINETADFTITVNVDAGATCGSTITNTATVTTSGTDSNTANNSASDTNTVVCPNVSIVKSGGPTGNVAQGPAGVALSYTITINNTGAGTAPKTQIVDDLNDQLTNVVAVVNGAPPGAPSCAIGAGNVVTCGLFTLDAAGGANASASVTITATIPSAVCITVNNSASGTIHTGDANQSTIGPSNTLTTTTTGCGGGGGASPAISISKTANPPTVPSGDPVSYSITVTSFGTAPATNVTLGDTLPSIPGVTWSITSQPAGNPCSLAGNNLSCNFGTMNSPPQTTATVVVTSTNTTDASCGTFTNTASANALGLGGVQASATATVQCAAVGGLDLNKTGPATAKVGDTVTYTFTVSLAPGSPDLTGVTISDPICDPGTLAGPTGDDGDNVLEAGETWGFSCTHLVTKSDPDPLPNTATACGVMPSGASVCDSDNHEIDIINPDIDVVKTADPTSGTPGSTITFTYTVTNSGDVPLTNVSVDDNVLGHICTIAVLPPKTTVTCTGTYVIPANASGTITNIVIAGGTDPAGDLVEAQDDFTITVVAGETVLPTKTPPGGLAFTGQATAIPIAGVALLLLSVGTALLWIGRRRGRARTEGPAA